MRPQKINSTWLYSICWFDFRVENGILSDPLLEYAQPRSDGIWHMTMLIFQVKAPCRRGWDSWSVGPTRSVFKHRSINLAQVSECSSFIFVRTEQDRWDPFVCVRTERECWVLCNHSMLSPYSKYGLRAVGVKSCETTLLLQPGNSCLNVSRSDSIGENTSQLWFSATWISFQFRLHMKWLSFV